MSRPQVQLLTRAGCTICDGVHAQLKQLADELDFDLEATDVDAKPQQQATPPCERSSATGCRSSCLTAASTATGRSTSPGCARIWPTGDFGVNLVAHQVTVYGGKQFIHRC